MLAEILAVAKSHTPLPPSMWAPYKLPIFFLIFFGFLTYGYITCRIYKNGHLLIFGIMVASLVMPIALSLTFMPNEDYKQATRGLEIHLADLCAIVLLLYLVTSHKRAQVVWFPPMTLPFILFFLMVALSWFFAEGTVANPMAADPKHKMTLGLEPVFRLSVYPIWEMIKLLRGFFVFWIAVNITREDKAIEVLKFVCGMLLVYLTIHALFDRYILHMHRINAGMGHFNNFNTFVGMLGMFLFPWIFYSKRLSVASVFFTLVLCAFVCIVLSISRTALAAFVLAVAIGTPVLLIRFFTVKNLLFITLAAFGMVLITAKAYHTLVERFEHINPTSASYHNREILNQEGLMMAHDHLFGVGMGNFSAWSIMHYAEYTGAELGMFAHNTFYLQLGETGWPGLIAFLIYWGRYMQISIYSLFSYHARRDPFLFTTLMAVSLAILFLIPQMLFQFTYRVTPVFLLAHVFMGIAVGRYLMIRERNLQQKLRQLQGIAG